MFHSGVLGCVRPQKNCHIFMQLQFFQTYRNYFIFHDIITQNEKSVQILLIKHESSNEFPVYDGVHLSSPSQDSP